MEKNEGISNLKRRNLSYFNKDSFYIADLCSKMVEYNPISRPTLDTVIFTINKEIFEIQRKLRPLSSVCVLFMQRLKNESINYSIIQK